VDDDLGRTLDQGRGDGRRHRNGNGGGDDDVGGGVMGAGWLSTGAGAGMMGAVVLAMGINLKNVKKPTA